MTLRGPAAMAAALTVAGCAATGAPAPSPPRAFSACLVTTAGGVNDRGFNQLAVRGLEAARSSLLLTTRVVESRAESDYLPNLQRCVQGGADLTIAISAEMANAMFKVAGGRPTARFALVDAAPVDDDRRAVELPNVANLLFKAQESGYLVGVLAGLMEKRKLGAATRNVVGILGSSHIPAVDRYIAGYVAGARSVNPGLIIKLNYSDATDQAFCKQVGFGQINAQADILFGVTSACGTGYIDAAFDAGVYAIGSDRDLAYVSPAVITSAVKRVDRVVVLSIKRAAGGSFRAGNQLLGLAEEATGYSTPSSVVPQDVINQVEDVKAKIRNGALVPPETIPPGI